MEAQSVSVGNTSSPIIKVKVETESQSSQISVGINNIATTPTENEMETDVGAPSSEMSVQKDSSQETKEETLESKPEKMDTQSVDSSPIAEAKAKPTCGAGGDSASEQNPTGNGKDTSQQAEENDALKKDPPKEDKGVDMGAAAAASNLPPEFCPRDAGFTSEKFKIEILGLPRQFGFAQLRKRLSVTMGLKPHKLKALPNKNFAYVCFSSEEDREQALEAINGHVWKGKTLRAKKAQPAADPMKRKLEESANKEKEENPTKRVRLDNTVPPAIRLRSCVEPLWDMPYEEQLKCKTEKAQDALKAVASHGDVKEQFMKSRKFNCGMCCALDPIIPSPVMEGYRNKSEFSVGRSEDDSETVVGFRFGLYKDGTDGVGSPSEVSIISPDSKKVVQSFEQYIRQSRYPPFNHRTHLGHWRQLTVRTTREGGGTLAVAEFVVNNTTEEAMAEEKEAIHKYFTEGEGKTAGVTTFYFRPCSARTSNSISQEPYQLVYGDGHIHETMGDMKFRISPSAFFQVNTLAAQVLYNKIAELCSVTPDTILLDICCGTGTIGQFMAKNVAKVIGIEMCKEAIEDAEINAALNGVTNVTYHCARVENVIQDIMRREGDNLGTNPVAILDPPRGGVQSSVVKSLRKCRSLNRIVYAACNPAGAKNNFVDLLRPKSRKTAGDPFKVVRAVPIDMFPSTNHCELLVLFERTPHQGNTSSESD